MPTDPNPSPKSLPVINTSVKLDELRKEAPAEAAHHTQTLIDRAIDPSTTSQQKALAEKVIGVLRTIYDPEIPVNIYDMGLIYNVQIDAENHVHIAMTLTAPACPVAGSLPPEVERKVETIDEVKSCDVELVWDPPWTKGMMSEAALLELGLL